MVKRPESAGADRPSVGAGVGIAFVLYFVGLALFTGTASAIPYPLLKLWPFLLITVLAAVLLFSKRWRRFATGILIVSAAIWIIVIGPCYPMLSTPYYA